MIVRVRFFANEGRYLGAQDIEKVLIVEGKYAFQRNQTPLYRSHSSPVLGPVGSDDQGRERS